jgi:hypothetical protein
VLSYPVGLSGATAAIGVVAPAPRKDSGRLITLRRRRYAQGANLLSLHRHSLLFCSHHAQGMSRGPQASVCAVLPAACACPAHKGCCASCAIHGGWFPGAPGSVASPAARCHEAADGCQAMWALLAVRAAHAPLGRLGAFQPWVGWRVGTGREETAGTGQEWREGMPQALNRVPPVRTRAVLRTPHVFTAWKGCHGLLPPTAGRPGEWEPCGPLAAAGGTHALLTYLVVRRGLCLIV